MTDLIDRYLAAIARELPEKQRADITAELRDELMSRVEAQEDRQGRPLSESEFEALLLDFGNPLVVAGRYRRTQHLIGPGMYPFWWAALRVVLLVVAALYIALTFLVIAGGEGVAEAVERATPSLVDTLVFAFGGVTLTCAVIERFGGGRALARWKPSALPPAKGRSRRRFDIMVEIAMGVVAILWWTGAIHFQRFVPNLWFQLELAPIWITWWWPILAYLTYELAMNLSALFQPGRIVLNRGLMLVRNLAGAGILTGVVQAGSFVEVASATIPPSALMQVQANFDQGFRVGITIAILVFVTMAAVEAWQLRGALRLGAGPTPA